MFLSDPQYLCNAYMLIFNLFLPTFCLPFTLLFLFICTALFKCLVLIVNTNVIVLVLFLSAFLFNLSKIFISNIEKNSIKSSYTLIRNVHQSVCSLEIISLFKMLLMFHVLAPVHFKVNVAGNKLLLNLGLMKIIILMLILSKVKRG